ncbi:MAG: ester cyclase [Actinomycetota bacterium]|nr:ester cyclase [Actinomycetota bacterium]
MPTTFDISLSTAHPVDSRIVQADRRERRQPMAGFEDTFTDIVDFILRATHRIWDEKGIGYLYEHYRSNTRVVDDSGIVYGRDQVIANTTQMIAAFPDMRCFADEIIWCGDESQGFWVSHRVSLVGRNTGYSRWGAPTGRNVVITCIANTYSRNNQISDEYVVYNTASLIQQLGLDLPEQAQLERAARAGGSATVAPAHGDAQRLQGQGRPSRPLQTFNTDGAVGDSVRATLDAIWNWRMLDRVDAAYSAGLRFHGPTDREMCGLGDYKAYLLSILAMFPDLAYEVDDLSWMGNDADGYVTAIRWSITGTHLGHGPYGPPTGRPVHMWGITHYQIRDGIILEEWTVSNEFDTLVQLAPDSD